MEIFSLISGECSILDLIVKVDLEDIMATCVDKLPHLSLFSNSNIAYLHTHT
jgi:hypothetical protein